MSTGFRLNSAPDLRVRLTDGSAQYEVDLGAEGPRSLPAMPFRDGAIVHEEGQAFYLRPPSFDSGARAGAASDGVLLSPMPGRVISVDVRQGDSVAKGQKLLTLEAMKMEHSLTAPFEGVVAELGAVEGAQVSEGTLLVRVEKGETP
jgi:3-methylcrotonyl-CoA carboxylase alpha subunit